MQTANAPEAQPEFGVRMPRALWIIFFLGSIASVITVYVLTQQGWAEITERARAEMSLYPVVREQIGEIVEIRLDPERRASRSNPDQVAMDLFGTLGVGVVQVELVESEEGLDFIPGETLRVGDREYPLLRGDPPPR